MFQKLLAAVVMCYQNITCCVFQKWRITPTSAFIPLVVMMLYNGNGTSQFCTFYEMALWMMCLKLPRYVTSKQGHIVDHIIKRRSRQGHFAMDQWIPHWGVVVVCQQCCVWASDLECEVKTRSDFNQQLIGQGRKLCVAWS